MRDVEDLLADTWYLDEVFTRNHGESVYFWRAVDEDEDTIDLLARKRRNTQTAKRFSHQLLKGQRASPRRIMTDKLKSHSAALRLIMPTVPHCSDRYANKRAAVSHEPTGQRERMMRGLNPLGKPIGFPTYMPRQATCFALEVT
ncbi:MAG: DDE-type integrase/transposase/recombinase [Rhodothermales bacterium]